MILTPQDSFDSVPDTFYRMETDTTTATSTPNTTAPYQYQPPHERPSTDPIDRPTYPVRSTLPATEDNHDNPDKQDNQDNQDNQDTHRCGRHCLPVRGRGRRDSDVSELSLSPTRFRGGLPIRFHSPIMEPISSHHDLFAPSDSDLNSSKTDRFVLLSPFNREVYVTTHSATRTEFTHWLPLLSSAAPETWYAFVTPDIPISLSLSSLYTHLHTVPSTKTKLKPLLDARPVGLRLPRISASAALQPSDIYPAKQAGSGSGSGSESENGNGNGNGKGTGAPELIYLSVQHSITGRDTQGNGRYFSPDRHGLPDLAGRSVTGQSIYRVIRVGSREEAAAQAFYQAGGNRWSTVFTCVVRGVSQIVSGQGIHINGGGYVRESTLQELVDGDYTSEDGRVKVFY